MSKVIKAGLARMAEPEPVKEQPEEPVPAEPDESPEEFHELDAPVEPDDKCKDVREAYQAAYDDLIQAAQDEVSAMLDDARRDALSIMREAENHANTVREQAWDEGYGQAYEQGKRECDELIAKARTEIDETLSRLPVERERMLDELEAQMLDVALEVAGKILHMELDKNDDAYLSMLRGAVARMPSEDAVTIRLNTKDYERFFNKRQTRIQTKRGPVDASLIEDPAMERYGAVIESPGGVVDAGADAQLKQMKKNMGAGDN